MRKGNDWRKKDQVKEGTEWDKDRGAQRKGYDEESETREQGR